MNKKWDKIVIFFLLLILSILEVLNFVNHSIFYHLYLTYQKKKKKKTFLSLIFSYLFNPSQNHWNKKIVNK